MFEMLKTVRREVATEAVYLAGLRLRERAAFPDWRRWLVLRTGDPVFPASVEVAVKLLEEMEIRMAKPLPEFSDGETRTFQRCIHDIMDARHAAAYPDRDGRAQRILEELRRDYGRPDWRAVA